jgi:hypothetical protein
MSAHYRSLGDLARNGCDEYGDLFGPEEENPAGCCPMDLPTGAEIDQMARHFGQEPPAPSQRDYDLLVSRAIGAMQGVAWRLRIPGMTDNAFAAERLESLAEELLAVQRARRAARLA